MSSNDIELKLCVNCLHVGTTSDGNAEKFKCFAPQNFKSRSLVDGSKIYNIPLCVDQRNYEVFECSKLGNWWTPVPEGEYVKTAIGWVKDPRPLDARPENRAAVKAAAAGMDLSSGVDDATMAASKAAAAKKLAALAAKGKVKAAPVTQQVADATMLDGL